MKNYFGIWSILTAALIVIALLSCLDRISVFGMELKPSTIAEKLTRIPEAPENNPIALADEKLKPTKPVNDTVALDTASQSILIIGDSMLEGLNPRLAAYAKENGHRLNSVIWYSSTTEYWGKSDTLKVFLRKFKPTFIFISLGANELFVRNIEQDRDRYVKSLLKQIGDIPYVWIGPPNWKKDTGINRLIAANVPAGCFFLSDGMKFDRQKDGAHPTHESAAKWLDSVARWMPRHGAHPIKMKKPEARSGRPQSVTVLQPLH